MSIEIKRDISSIIKAIRSHQVSQLSKLQAKSLRDAEYVDATRDFLRKKADLVFINY